MLPLLLALACSTPPAAPPAPPATPPAEAPAKDAAATGGAPAKDAASVPTLLGDAPGVAFIGDWTSASCGGRAYARNISFLASNEFAAIDLVSPCPKGTTCVWSGMAAYAGIWVQEGTKLQLREVNGATTPGGPHPTLFEATTDGKLVENGCTYEKGLTVPTGYTEDEVRPRVPGDRPPAGAAPAAPAGSTPQGATPPPPAKDAPAP